MVSTRQKNTSNTIKSVCHLQQTTIVLILILHGIQGKKKIFARRKTASFKKYILVENMKVFSTTHHHKSYLEKIDLQGIAFGENKIILPNNLLYHSHKKLQLPKITHSFLDQFPFPLFRIIRWCLHIFFCFYLLYRVQHQIRQC